MQIPSGIWRCFESSAKVSSWTPKKDAKSALVFAVVRAALQQARHRTETSFLTATVQVLGGMTERYLKLSLRTESHCRRNELWFIGPKSFARHRHSHRQKSNLAELVFAHLYEAVLAVVRTLRGVMAKICTTPPAAASCTRCRLPSPLPLRVSVRLSSGARMAATACGPRLRQRRECRWPERGGRDFLLTRA